MVIKERKKGGLLRSLVDAIRFIMVRFSKNKPLLRCWLVIDPVEANSLSSCTRLLSFAGLRFLLNVYLAGRLRTGLQLAKNLIIYS